MSADIEEAGHGNSPAAWTAVVVMLVGIAIGTVAFFFAIVWLVWASVVVIGALLGWILAKAGFGVGGSRVAQKGH
jgi:hypothetical protein